MSQRAQELAERFVEVAEAFAAEVERLSPQQWRAYSAGEERTVAALARHVAWGYEFEMAVFAAIAEGRPYDTVTNASMAALNAAHGMEFGDCAQTETVALLRQNAASAAAGIRALSDEHLARSGVFLEEAAAERVDTWIEHVLIGHPQWHLDSIRAATVECPE
jgi:hypothetical protein